MISPFILCSAIRIRRSESLQTLCSIKTQFSPELQNLFRGRFIQLFCYQFRLSARKPTINSKAIHRLVIPDDVREETNQRLRFPSFSLSTTTAAVLSSSGLIELIDTMKYSDISKVCTVTRHVAVVGMLCKSHATPIKRTSALVHWAVANTRPNTRTMPTTCFRRACCSHNSDEHTISRAATCSMTTTPRRSR